MTGMDVPVGFGGELRMGTVRVPDARIDTLSEVFSPRKTTYAEITFCDIPGEYGAENKGLSPRGLQQIRDQEALCLVLRDFVNPALEGSPDPTGDLDAFHAECVLADLEIVERRLDRLRKERGDANEIAKFEIMKQTLEEERPLRSLSNDQLPRERLKGFGLLTDRPLFVALNREEGAAGEGLPVELKDRIATLGAGGLSLCAPVEAEIAALDPDDQAAFLDDLGVAESALDRFIRAAYGLLELISFFTVGEDEVRAWPIARGTRARQAAGRIHSDLERGFIRAEVIPYAVFMEYGSEAAVRDSGKLQIEGKDYEVKDGDILHVRFNV
jgi:GTP-binding protein YchF